jgi:L-aminopeptidase/D-esterase-like protein
VADASGTQRRTGLRERGLPIDAMAIGPSNAITDVGEVHVGYVTATRSGAVSLALAG